MIMKGLPKIKITTARIEKGLQLMPGGGLVAGGLTHGVDSLVWLQNDGYRTSSFSPIFCLIFARLFNRSLVVTIEQGTS
jgi:hypothetical protein